MNLIDSSFWLEFYKESEFADLVSDKIKEMTTVIVPTIIIVEVFKKLLSVTSESKAINFIGQMKKGNIMDADIIKDNPPSRK